jgi:hypothetical protein
MDLIDFTFNFLQSVLNLNLTYSFCLVELIFNSVTALESAQTQLSRCDDQIFGDRVRED